MRRHKANRGGWIMLDMITGLLLISIMTGVLAYGALRQRNNLVHLADIRAAQRMAEAALLSMQCNQSAPAGVTVKQLPESADVAGRVWVQVTATVNGRQASLFGLVPPKAVAMAGNPNQGGGL